MAWDGYLEFAGVDIINAERTEAYVRHQAPALSFRRRFATHGLAEALGDKPYEAPQLDEAPWWDPNVPATADFYGLYPMDIDGIDDSTLTATVSERAGDGGSVGAQREASKPIRVHGLLVAANQEAAQAGLVWLKAALKDVDCGSTNSCGGSDIRYFTAQPDLAARPAFAAAATAEWTQRFGTVVAPNIADFRFPDSVPLDMPAEAHWTFSAQEGARFSYGSFARFGTGVLSESAGITPLRRNHIPNPTFRAGTELWEGLGGSTVEWALDGGADGPSYGVVTGGVPVDASGSYGSGRFGGGVYGIGDGTASTGGTATVRTPVMQPVGRELLLSLALRATTPGQSATVTLRDGVSNATIATGELSLAAVWDRYSLAVPTGYIAANGVYLVVSSDATFALDEAMLEVGAELLDYFDGSTPFDGYITEWEGVADASVSVRRWAGVAEYGGCDSDFRPFLKVRYGEFRSVVLHWAEREAPVVAELLEPVERFFHSVACAQGPKVIAEYPDAGGAYIEVDFVLVAEKPGSFSRGLPLDVEPFSSAQYVDPAPVPELDDDWLFDPNNVIPTAPPRPPAIIDTSLEAVTNWTRYYVEIPAANVALWAQSVLTLAATSHDTSINQVRVRFHPNPFGFSPERVDPLSFCSEFIVSFLPEQTRLVLNGTVESATASKPGKATVPADHLLYGTGGGPMTWPELSCGIPYVLTVDVPQSTALGDFDLELEIARRE